MCYRPICNFSRQLFTRSLFTNTTVSFLRLSSQLCPYHPETIEILFQEPYTRRLVSLMAGAGVLTIMDSH